MTDSGSNRPTGRKLLWAGRIISALPVILMAGGGVMMLLHPTPQMLDGLNTLGYPASKVTTICLLELACVVLYVIPPTSVLGAVLLTAYLGGATASHIRVGQTPIMPIAVAIIVWIGVCLREPRLWSLVPLRRRCNVAAPTAGQN